MKQLFLLLLTIFPLFILAQNPNPKTLSFDYQTIKSNISLAKSNQGKANLTPKIIVDLPTPNGTIKSFEVEETSNFDVALSKKYPDRKSVV